jgi:hypothetical protein
MDFRKCLPLTHERATPTAYLVISGRDLDSAGRLEEAYPGARVSEPLDLWQTTGTLLEIPAGALAPEPPQRAYARFEPGLELYGYEWSGGALHWCPIRSPSEFLATRPPAPTTWRWAGIAGRRWSACTWSRPTYR